MKKTRRIYATILCVILVMSMLSVAALACPNPGCESSARTAYCGGGTTITGLTHTFTYYDPFWPFNPTPADCTYAYVNHSTYGKCNACGYIYPQGSDVFFPHVGQCAHQHVKCNETKVAVCSSGNVLSWYF